MRKRSRCSTKNESLEKRFRENAFAKALEFDGPDSSARASDIASIVVESSYDGPRLPDPVPTSADKSSDGSTDAREGLVVSMQFVHDTIAHFKNQKLLHRKYVLQILQAIRDYFKKRRRSRLSRFQEGGRYSTHSYHHFNWCPQSTPSFL